MQKKRVFLLLVLIGTFLLLIGLRGEVKAYTLKATESNFSATLTNGYNDSVGDTLGGKTSDGIKWKATVLEVDNWIRGKQGNGKVSITIEEIPENIESFEIPSKITLNKKWGLISFEYNYDVTTISMSAFKNCSKVERIIIPNSITTIEGKGFVGCEKLRYVEVASDNTTFKDNGEGILLSKDGTKLVFYPEDKKEVQYKIPDGIKTIGKYAFASNNNLESIIISSNVQEIEGYAFYKTNISKIDIPNSVTKLGEGLFYGCKNLKEVNLPTNLTQVFGYMFSECTGLEAVKLPDTITKIDHFAFENCTNLKKIEIPKSVSEIGINVFYNCANLKEVKFEKNSNLKTINLRAFGECKSLKTIEIPEGVETIYKNTFNGCSELKAIVIPNSLKTLGYTDEEKEALQNYIPKFLQKYLEEYSKKEELTEEQKKQLTEYINYIFDDTGIKDCSKDLIIYIPNNETITNMIKSDYAPAYMIYQKNAENVVLTKYQDIKGTCTNLEILDYIYDLPVERIENDILKNNTKIQKVVLPEKLKEVGARAFYNVTSLKEIYIPKSVEKIGDKAFYGCDNLNRVIIEKGSAISSIEENSFDSCSKDLKIYHDGENELINNFASKNGNKIEFISDNESPFMSISKNITSAKADIIIKVKDTKSGVYRYKINKTKKAEGEAEAITVEGEWILVDDSFEKEGDLYIIKQTITENCSIEIIIEDAVGNENNPDRRKIDINGIDEEAPKIENIDIIGSKESATIKIEVTDEGGSRLSKYALSESSNINTIKEEEWKVIAGNTNTINAEVVKNGTYYLFILDGKGNIANKLIEVNKIDKVKPVISSISTTTQDNKFTLEIFVEDKGDEGYEAIGLEDYAIYSEEDKDKEKEWIKLDKIEGKNPKTANIKDTIECNGTWYIEIRDAYQNSEINELKVDGLVDTNAPVISFGEVTNKEVMVNVKDEFSGIKVVSLEYAWSKDAEKAPTAGYINVNTNIEENTKKISFKADASNLTGEYYLWIKINNLEDKAGNKNTEGNMRSEKYIFDNTNPKIETTTAEKIIGKNGDTKIYEITFSEDVEKVNNKELIITNTNQAQCTATIKQKDLNNKKEWIIEIKIGAGNGTSSITIPKDMFKDNVGNTLINDVVLGNIITIDNTNPSIAEGDTVVTPSVISSTKTVKYEIKFNEETIIDNSKMQEIKFENEEQAIISNGTIPTITIEGTKCTIEVSVEPKSEVNGDAVLVLPEGLFYDNAANKTTEIKLKGLKIDTKRPTIIEQKLVSEDKYINKDQKAIYTIKTDKDIVQKENIKILVNGEGITGYETKVVKGEDNKTWSIEIYNITGDGEGTITIPEGLFEDNIGNKINEVTLTNNIKVDNTAPTVEVSTPILSENKESATFKITATDAKSSIDSYIISTNENITIYDKWEAITADGVEKVVKANGIYYIFVKDKAGNIGKAKVTVDGIIDKIAPVATITGPDREYANNETEVKYIVTLSEKATKDESINPKFKEEGIFADIKIEQKTNEVWEITVSKLSGNGEATLILPAGIFADEAGNKSVETEKTGLKVDNKEPSVEKIITAQKDKILVTIKADEKIQNIEGWTLSDDAKIITKEFSEDYIGNIEIKDLIGNKITEKVEIVFVKEVVILSKTEVTSCKKGDIIELTSKVNPENATIKEIKWKSSNESIATVDENGKVTCKEEGKVTITATAHNGVSGKFEFEIVKNNTVESIEITKQPNKKKYIEGDTFNPEGMEVCLVYSEGNKEKTTDYTCTPNIMTEGTKELTITYNKNESITTKLTGIEVYKKADVKEVTISKDEYEKIKDLISDDIIEIKIDNDNVIIKLKSDENITITVDNAPKEVYNTDEVFNASIYKVSIKKGDVIKQIPLTNTMISFDENLLDKTTYKFKEAAQGKEIEITVNYLGITTKFKVTVTSNKPSDDVNFGDLTLIVNENVKYLRTDNDLNVKELIKNLKDANPNISLEIKVFDVKGKEVLDSQDKKSTTNMKIKIKNGQEETEYVLIVRGDLNSDGEINILDIMKLLQHVAETQATNQKDEAKILNGAYLLAADISKDGKTGLQDITQLLRLVSDLMAKK